MDCTVAPSAVEEYLVAARAHAANHIAAPPIPAPSRKKRSSPGMTTSCRPFGSTGPLQTLNTEKLRCNKKNPCSILCAVSSPGLESLSADPVWTERAEGEGHGRHRRNKRAVTAGKADQAEGV